MGGTPWKTPPGPALLSLFEERTPTCSSDPAQGQTLPPSRLPAQNMARMSGASSTASAASDSSSLTTSLMFLGPGTPTSSNNKPSLNNSYSQFLNCLDNVTTCKSGSTTPRNPMLGRPTPVWSTPCPLVDKLHQKEACLLLPTIKPR
ncbi:hypothetical protein EDB19DRAFT_1828685 [Suillus lakei]|nr:hypothetical protein EDB19DRAFT_1828685 [Suillus lakei]